jgi:hypothetical protein
VRGVRRARFVSCCLALCAAPLLPAAAQRPAVAGLLDEHWRVRNEHAVRLCAATTTLERDDVGALWAIAAPEPELFQWPAPAIQGAMQLGGELEPRFVLVPEALLVPEGPADLVVAFAPRVLAALVLEARTREPEPHAFDRLLDAALAERDEAVAIVLARLVRRCGDRATAELQRRLESGEPPWTASRARLSLLRLLARASAEPKPVLRRLAAHRDAGVRAAAPLVLGTLPLSPDDAVFAAQRLVADEGSMLEALGVLDRALAAKVDTAGAADVLGAALEHEDAAVRGRACEALAHWRGPRSEAAAAALGRALLRGEHIGASGGVVRALGYHARYLRAPDVIARLVELANDPIPAVARAACGAVTAAAAHHDAVLERVLADAVFPAPELRRALQRPPWRGEEPAVRAFADGAFAAALAATPAGARAARARGLANARADELPGFVAWLRAELGAAEPARVRAAARVAARCPDALRALAGDLVAGAAALGERGDAVWDALVVIDPSGLPRALLAKRLSAPGPFELPPPLGSLPVEELAPLLEHKERDVREQAAFWLGAHPSGLPALAAALHDRNRAVRLRALAALAAAARIEPRPADVAAVLAKVVPPLRARLTGGAVPFRGQAAAELAAVDALEPADLEALAAAGDHLAAGNAGWSSMARLEDRFAPITRLELVGRIAALPPAAVTPPLLRWLEEQGSRPDDDEARDVVAHARVARRAFGGRR